MQDLSRPSTGFLTYKVNDAFITKKIGPLSINATFLAKKLKMVDIEAIIALIKPKEVIGNSISHISTAIQLDTRNERTDVLIWVSPQNSSKLTDLKQGVLICNQIEKRDIQPNCTYLVCDNPRLAFQKAVLHFFTPKREIGIAKSAFIAETAQLGESIFIGQNVVIEDNCEIGNNTSIGHNTVIKKGTIIGSEVIIGSNTVIGGVGFGYEKDETGVYVFIPHIGNVVIKDKVEIGNNTCIDRAVLGSTMIENNVKIDNLVHIAHGVFIDENALIIANAMVAGSVKIGKNAWIAPSASILNQKTIGRNATVGLGAIVVKDVADNIVVVGNPARDINSK
jgi:UDP-3-O-[3-hydroxymyristoyl] glucosamine N-acyltransferase